MVPLDVTDSEHFQHSSYCMISYKTINELPLSVRCFRHHIIIFDAVAHDAAKVHIKRENRGKSEEREEKEETDSTSVSTQKYMMLPMFI